MRFVLALGLVLSSSVFAADNVPECRDGNRVIPVDNQQVLHWKSQTPNAWKGRAHVKGPVVRMFADRNGHDHFEIQIGDSQGDVLEVVYNHSFGMAPDTPLGTEVEACGDYITSIAQTGPYPPSPSGAIIHWLHRNPRNGGHEHGWMAYDGKVYGMRMGNNGGHNDAQPCRGRRCPGFLPFDEVFPLVPAAQNTY